MGLAFRKKKDMPSGLWLKCKACRKMVYKKQVEEKLGVCPECGFHGKIRGKLDFNILGMIQIEYPSGYWTEWRLRVGENEYWLQEDEGIYVLFDKRAIEDPLPAVESFQAGGITPQ